jgi:hypothetical protein
MRGRATATYNLVFNAAVRAAARAGRIIAMRPTARAADEANAQQQ